jgi:hypothetical protein
MNWFAPLTLCIALCADAASSEAQSPPRQYVGTVSLTIGGGEETSDALIFSDIRGLLFDKQGRIFVADNGENNVRVFSPAGKLVYTIGRKGQGPGDLMGPCCLAFDSKDQLWVKEADNHRFSVFALGADRATFVTTVSADKNPYVALDRVAWDSSENVVDVATAFVLTTREFGLVRRLLGPDGAVRSADTVPNPSKDSVPRWTLARGGGSSTYMQPYGARQLRAFGPNGETAEAISSRYVVLWRDVRGKRIALLRGSAVPPGLSDRERSNASATLDAIVRQTGVARSSLPFYVPEQKPVLSDLGFDLDGRLWVERSVADGAPGEADVYDRTGRWVARMKWARGTRMSHFAVQGLRGLAVATDSLGVPRVVRLEFR